MFDFGGQSKMYRLLQAGKMSHSSVFNKHAISHFGFHRILLLLWNKFELTNLHSYTMPNLIYPAEDESTASCHLSSKALKIVQEGFKQLQEWLYSFLC